MSATQTIPTAIPALILRSLTDADAAAYLALVRDSLDHLTRHGDYGHLRALTTDAAMDELSSPGDRLVLGLRLDGTLIGRIDLIEREPGIFVIGYWLGSGHTGHGYMTHAAHALIEHARRHRAATTVYAGVTKGNVASERLLQRLGFASTLDLVTYTRFRLDLAPFE